MSLGLGAARAGFRQAGSAAQQLTRPGFPAPRARCRAIQTRIQSKMHVPEGVSPERQAAQSLRAFFTYISMRIVLSQLEGIGRGDLGGYNSEQLTALRSFYEANPIRDGEEWLSKLMAENKLLAVRIMEVRAAYCADDEFEWDSLRRLVQDETREANVRVLREHAISAFVFQSMSEGWEASMEAGSGGSGEGEEQQGGGGR
eukprot:scaffold2.g7424.t1